MVDFIPTLSALAGLDIPASAAGRDLSDHLRHGTTPQANDALYASYFIFGTWYSQNERIDPLCRCRAARGVRTLRHTYVEDLTGPWLLYDNQTDPYQMNNLVDSPAHAPVRQQLAARLRQILAERRDDFDRARRIWIVSTPA